MKKTYFDPLKVSIFIFGSFTFFSPPAIAKGGKAANCTQAIQLIQQRCKVATDKAKSETPNDAQDGAAGGMPGGADQLGGALGQGVDVAKQFLQVCPQQLVDSCSQTCQKENKRPQLNLCKKAMNNRDMAQQQVAADQNSQDQAKQTGKQSGNGAMPPMQMPQQQQQQPTPPPTPVAAPSSQTNCSDPVQAMTKACQPKTAQDQNAKSATPAGFSPGTPSAGAPAAGAGLASTPTANNASAAQPNSNQSSMLGGMPMMGGMSPPSGSGLGSSPPQKDAAAGAGADPNSHSTSTDILNGERGGGGSGGGFSGYGTGNSDTSQLAAYLPGGSKDPRRSLASVGGAAIEHPDIGSVHEDIFNRISKRMQIICALKELRDCH